MNKKSLEPESDRPTTTPSADKHGFIEMAEKLAPSIIAATSGDGLVVGVEGQWGAGKTTFMGFLTEKLKDGKEETLHVISIAPWLNGDSSSLVKSLLDPMAEIISTAETQKMQKDNDTSALNQQAGDKFKEKIKSYAIETSRVAAPASRILGYVLPGATEVAKILETAGDYLRGSQIPIEEVKSEISQKITELDLRFIVVIDDLDRLEPAQAVEVIRLVRSVADFPQVVYLMCYDRNVLSKALKKHLKVDDGDLFLQKIIQLSFAIPRPEPFDLRNSMREQALKIYETVHGCPPSENILSEVKSAIDGEGSGLTTPREVKLALNGIRFFYPNVSDEVNFADICRLHLIKVTNPKLYRWLETYLAERSVVVSGDGSVNTDEKRRYGKKLQKILPDKEYSSPRSIGHVAGFIPGIRTHDEPEKRVFSETVRRDIEDLVESKRLGSPVHYRYYFALTAPKTVLQDTEFDEILRLAKTDVSGLEALLTSYLEKPHPQDRNWFDYIIDRLDGIPIRDLDEETLKGLVFAITNIMDSVLRVRIELGPFFLSLSSKSEILVSSFLIQLREINSIEIDPLVTDIFQKSPSLNWIVGALLRTDLFRHGRVGERPESEQNRVFSSAQIARAIKILENRILEPAFYDTIPQLPSVSSFLFGWRDMSGEGPVQEWTRQFSKTDNGFLTLLEHLTSWAVSDRVYHPLQRSSVEAFMDWKKTESRLNALSENAADPEIQSKATELVEAIRSGDRH